MLKVAIATMALFAASGAFAAAAPQTARAVAHCCCPDCCHAGK